MSSPKRAKVEHMSKAQEHEGIDVHFEEYGLHQYVARVLSKHSDLAPYAEQVSKALDTSAINMSKLGDPDYSHVVETCLKSFPYRVFHVLVRDAHLRALFLEDMQRIGNPRFTKEKLDDLLHTLSRQRITTVEAYEALLQTDPSTLSSQFRASKHVLQALLAIQKHGSAKRENAFREELSKYFTRVIVPAPDPDLLSKWVGILWTRNIRNIEQLDAALLRSEMDIARMFSSNVGLHQCLLQKKRHKFQVGLAIHLKRIGQVHSEADLQNWVDTFWSNGLRTAESLDQAIKDGDGSKFPSDLAAIFIDLDHTPVQSSKPDYRIPLSLSRFVVDNLICDPEIEANPFSEDSLPECYTYLESIMPPVCMPADLGPVLDGHVLASKALADSSSSSANAPQVDAINHVRQVIESHRCCAVLTGVSGAGKSFAIFQNAAHYLCLFFHPRSKLMQMFCLFASDYRNHYPYLAEQRFRHVLLQVLSKMVVCRYIMLRFLQERRGFQSNIELFLWQNKKQLAVVERQLLEYISQTFTGLGSAVLRDTFVAIDEAQIVFLSSPLRPLDRPAPDKHLSLARLFPWCGAVVNCSVVLAGTSLSLVPMDNLLSGERCEETVQVITQFPMFSSDDVRSRFSFHIGVPLSDDLLSRMEYWLQGRPRILMNFLTRLSKLGTLNSDLVQRHLDVYLSELLTRQIYDTWTLYSRWKHFFESNERETIAELTFASDAQSCSVEECYYRILLESMLNGHSKMLAMDSEAAGSAAPSTVSAETFIISAHQADMVANGICPLLSLCDSRHMFPEPATVLSGLNYILEHASCQSKFLQSTLGRMRSATANLSAFEFFAKFYVALKLSTDSDFREGLYRLAVDKGLQTPRTTWVSSWRLPKTDALGFFRIVPDSTYPEFVESFDFDSPQHKFVFVAPSSAGPDIKWNRFVLGLRTSPELLQVSDSRSNQNAQSLDHRNFFSSLPQLQSRCATAVESIWASRKGLVRVQLELPFSSFPATPDEHLGNDVCLHLQLHDLLQLLPPTEADTVCGIFTPKPQ